MHQTRVQYFLGAWLDSHTTMKRKYKTESIKVKFPQLKSFTVSKRKQFYSVADVPNNVYLCKACRFIAKSKEALALHHKTFHTDGRRKIFSCGKCDYITDYSKLYDTHLDYHLKSSMDHRENSRILQCTICQLITFDKSFLSNHMAEEHSHFKCQMCDFFSSFENVLSEHVMVFHGNVWIWCLLYDIALYCIVLHGISLWQQGRTF